VAVRRAQAQDEARAREIIEINRSAVQTREDVRAAEMLNNNSTSQGPGIEPPNFYSTAGSRRDGSGHPLPLPLHMTPHHALLPGSNHVALHNHHHHPHHPHLSHHHPAHHHLAVTAAASHSASVINRLRPMQNSVDDEESTSLPIITSPPMSSRGKGGCSDNEMDSVDNKSTEGGRSISRSTTDRESVRGRSPKPISSDHRRKSSPINVGSGSNSITPSTSAASSILASKMYGASRERGNSSSSAGTGSTSSALIRSAAAAVGWPPLIDPLFAKHHHHGTNGTNVNTLLALPSSVGNGGGSGSTVTSPTSMAAMAAAAAAVSCGVDPATAHFGALKMYPHFGKLSEIAHFLNFMQALKMLKETSLFFF